MSSYNVEAIVLSTRQFSESDKIMTVFSLEEGKFDVIAKGARKPTGKNVGVANPFCHLKMSVFKGKTIDTLTQAEIVNSFPKLRKDISLMAYASYIMELVKELSAYKDKNEIVFKLLLRTLEELSFQALPEIVTAAFELKVMVFSGFKPEFRKCILCRKTENLNKFSVEHGGVICSKCLPLQIGVLNISNVSRKTAIDLMGNDYVKIRELKIDREGLRELEQVMQTYIYAKLDRALKSKDFICDVRQIDENVKS